MRERLTRPVPAKILAWGTAVLVALLQAPAALAQKSEDAQARAESLDPRYVGYEGGDLFPNEPGSAAAWYALMAVIVLACVFVTFKNAKRNLD